jgi:hypothetical protein|tara:strand:- start:571 stop:711 length:141 start_codon:yes stop_codon:yes gene_type:complete
MDFRITLLGDGALLGFTYFSKDDVADEDWNELNLYLVICCLTWRWW